jgi:hypothetical protein
MKKLGIFLIVFLLSQFFQTIEAQIIEGDKISYPKASRELLETGAVNFTVIVKGLKVQSYYFSGPPYNFRFQDEVKNKILSWKYKTDGVYNIHVDFSIIRPQCDYYDITVKKFRLFNRKTTIESCAGNRLNNGVYIYRYEDNRIGEDHYEVKISITITDERAR